MSDRKVLSDGARTLEAHVVTGADHVEGMLIVYLPKDKLLIEADLFTPPAPDAEAASTSPDPDAGAAQLVENLERLHLDVARVVPLHGPGVASRADLDRAAGVKSARR